MLILRDVPIVERIRLVFINKLPDSSEKRKGVDHPIVVFKNSDLPISLQVHFKYLSSQTPTLCT